MALSPFRIVSFVRVLSTAFSIKCSRNLTLSKVTSRTMMEKRFPADSPLKSFSFVADGLKTSTGFLDRGKDSRTFITLPGASFSFGTVIR